MSLLIATLSLALSAAPAKKQPAHSPSELVAILQELAEDTNEAEEAEEHEDEEEGRAELIAEDALQVAKAIRGGRYVKGVRHLREMIEKGDEDEVGDQARRLIRTLVTEERIAIAPEKEPSLDKGAKVFAANCAACHGDDGSAQTQAAKVLKPAPANLRDKERMEGISPFRVFSAVSHGIPRTAMVGFPHLSEEERWAVAFYVFTLRQPPCDSPVARAPVSKLSSNTDEQLAAELGEPALACLRRMAFR